MVFYTIIFNKDNIYYFLLFRIENFADYYSCGGGVMLDFEEIAKAAKIMKFMSESEGMSTEEKFLKLFISSLKPEQKKNAEIITKYIEFESMAKRYKGSISIQNKSEKNWQKDMINDLKNNFDGKIKLKLYMVLKLIELN